MTIGPLATATQLETYRAGDPDMLVAAAQAVVRSYCRWHIAPSVTETVTLDSNGTNTLLLPSMHVTAVTAVRGLTMDDPIGYNMGYYGEGNYGDPPVILDGWSSVATPRFRSGILERTPYRWPMGVVEVDMTHGHDTVPPDVQLVVLDLAESIKGSMGGASRMQVGSVSIQYATDQLTYLQRQTLDAYRIPSAP